MSHFEAWKMLRIDFNQRFLDHRSILVFVKKLGAITESEFSELFDDISQLRTVELPNGRTVHLRYTRHLSHQFIEWGSFHMHKKLLGILSVAKLLDEDVSSIKTAHESLKSWYGNTALHSRCFVLGCEDKTEDKRDNGEFVFLNKDNIMEEIEKEVGTYAMALFLVLESKRMDKSLEKPEKFAFLRSPLDGEISVDADSRNKKQCIGRMKKYIGDLCLVTGVPEEAIFHYTVAIDLLRSVGDMLWMSGSLEGLCAASLLCQAENKLPSPERPSLQLDISQLSTAGPVNGTGSDGDEYKVASIIPLGDLEIVEKSEEIFQIYEKNKESKVLAIEARFKYARFFLSKKKYKDVSDALEDTLAIELNFKLSDPEKIQLYSAMAIMYEDIGYMRKAAFFTRKAARHCTSQHLPPQGWTASYNLMRNALDGYKIRFANKTTTKQDDEQGWPDLKIQLMRELIEMSKELQNTNIPIRHISYLLQTMHSHIEENDMQDLINMLEKLASTSQEQFNLVDNLVLSNNDILPPVALTELPIVREMKANALASHLRPIVNPLSPSPVKTPFIFSTLHKGPRKTKKANPVIRWVEGDVGEVAMQVFNPMPFDIKISKMTLLTEGVPFQAFPSCLALSNDNMSHPFMLLGIPEGPGELAITGYSVELFGIQSNCPITETILDKQFSLPLVVNVTPKLPLLQFQSEIKDVKSFVNSNHRGSSLSLEVKMHKGQSISGPVTVENVGKVPVEHFTITLLSTFKADKVNLVTIEQDHVTASLPLKAEASSQLNLTLHGILPEELQDGGILNWAGKLKVSYSGGEALKLGLSRQAAVDIRIEVIPSLHVVNYSVSSVEKGDGDHFEIEMDVINQTSHEVQWRFQMSTGIAYPDVTNNLSAGHSVRTALELEKFDLSGSDPKMSECEACSKKILDLVKLHWEIPDLKIGGVLNLDGLQVTEEMVNIVRKNQLNIEFSVDGIKAKKGDCISITASKPVFLSVTVYNSSEKEVSPSILNLEPFELEQDGGENFDVKQKICWLGATSSLLPTIQAKSTVEHTCGFLFLFPGQFYMNVKCFERVISNDDQPFRGRAHVIKALPGNRRSRSSRTDSFTDSLLLRQRSQSTPLAQFSYSIAFDVKEDPETIVDEVDTGLQLIRVSGKNISPSGIIPVVSEKDSSASEKASSISEKDSCVLEKDPQTAKKHFSFSDSGTISCVSRKDSSASKKDFPASDKDLQTGQRNFFSSSGTIPFVSVKDLQTTKNVHSPQDDDLKGKRSGENGAEPSRENVGIEQTCLGSHKQEDVLPCSNVTNNPGVKMDESKVGEFSVVKDDSNPQHTSIENSRVSLDRKVIALEEENLGENLLSQDSTNEYQYIAASNSSRCSGESEDINTEDTNSGDQVEECSKVEHDLCQTLAIQEIELNFKENESGQDKHSSEGREAKTQLKVKQELRTEVNETAEEISTRNANVERIDALSGEESDDTAVKSPSVKERIMFFNSS